MNFEVFDDSNGDKDAAVMIGILCPFCDEFVGEEHREIRPDELEQNRQLIERIMFRVENMHLQEHVGEMVLPVEEEDDGSG